MIAIGRIISPRQSAQIADQVDAVRVAIRARKWSLATERSYCAWVRRYGIHLVTAHQVAALPDSTARVTDFLRSLVTGPRPTGPASP